MPTNVITVLILIAIIAWCLQILLGWWQIHQFNTMFTNMIRSTYIGVGRSQGSRFKPKTLIALSINQDKIIIDSLLMSGLTIFAKPKKIVDIEGLSINNLDPEKIFPNNVHYQSALKSAIRVKNEE